MRIEILYPELCCLYGDKGNTMFLQQCLPDAEFVFTQLNDQPRFLTDEVDLCCMYSMSEQSQERILQKLYPHKEQIAQCCSAGKTLFLLLGNAMELFGQYIQREDGSRIDGLCVFDIYSVRHAPKRFNSLIQAAFENLTLLGYTSRFSDTYNIPREMAFCQVQIGTGSAPDTAWDGIHHGRVIATYLLGPLLVANPDFAKYLLRQLGVNEPHLPYENALYESYVCRRKEFQRPDLVLE